jgi:eukaryotic-like serine/threonine-protein kinase
MIDPSAVEQAFPQCRNIAPLALGGQKIVFRAEHSSHGPVALKLIRIAGNDPRAQREIEIVTTLTFKNVPRIHEFGTVNLQGQTLTYLCEEFIDGDSLRTRLQATGRLPEGPVLKVLSDLLATVADFEAMRLVHRDIKPDNILIGRDGRLWLIDLGIARVLGGTSLTATGAHFGPHTIGYAAPEQFRNVKPNIDSRADLFSVGVVVYEAHTGHNPFTNGARDSLEVMRRIEGMEPPLLVFKLDSDGKLGRFIGTLMNRYVSRRPRTAADALRRYSALVNAGEKVGQEPG